ncbi:MAG: hypothetical protein AAF493_24215, partial [Pseudomonadota bacterium]
DMDRYTQFQVANAVPDAAKAGGDGGLAGAGMGAGIGMAVGNALANSLGQGGASGSPSAGGSPEPKVMIRCTECNNLCDETAKFCPNCGNKLFGD